MMTSRNTTNPGAWSAPERNGITLRLGNLPTGAWLTVHTLLFAALFATATPLAALTFNVDSTSDFPDASPGDGVCASAGGPCTLRAAVMEGNALGGTHTINLPAGTHALSIPSGSSDTDATVGDLDLKSGTWSFNGAGMGQTVIDASAMNHRAFEIPVDLFFSGSVTFNDLTIQGGNSSGLGSSFNSGAAVRVGSRFASSIVFNRITITGNTGSSAIHTLANTTLNGSTVSNSSGIGLFQTNDGAQPTTNVRTLNISDSTISGNGSTGIAIGNNNGGSLVNSTVSGNAIHGLSAQFTNNRDFTITNSTITANGQDGVAGIGFTIFDPVFGNTPVRPNLLVRNSIVANNTRSDFTTPALDAEALVPQSGGFNIIGDASGGTNFTQTGDLASTNPVLAGLALNAPGTTATHALLAGSPAIDHASAAFAPPADQRGVTRPKGAADDSGAYEFQPTVSDLAVTKLANVGSASIGDQVVFTITVSNAGPDAVSDATISDDPGGDFSNPTWSCAASSGSVCSASGSGAINDSANILAGGDLTYTLTANIASGVSTGNVTNLASAAVPAGTSDPNVANNTDTAQIIIDLPPTAADDAVTVDEDSGATILAVLANDTDPNGNLDPASANTACGSCSMPNNGLLTNNGNGTFNYTPDADFFGADSFVYEVCDTDPACSTATVNITIDAVNDPPVFTAGPDPSFPAGSSGPQSIPDWPQNIDLGPNEIQAVSSYAVATVSDPDGILAGAVTINAAGDLSFTLTGASGSANLEATLTDDGGTANGGQDTSAPVAFTITVGLPSADLAVSLLRCIDRVVPGGGYPYGLRVINNGPNTASGVALTHTPIAGATVNSIGSLDCVDTGASVDCDLGMLSPGAVWQIGIEIQAPNVGQQTLTMIAEVVAATDEPNPANNHDQSDVEIDPGLVVLDGFESCGPL